MKMIISNHWSIFTSKHLESIEKMKQTVHFYSHLHPSPNLFIFLFFQWISVPTNLHHNHQYISPNTLQRVNIELINKLDIDIIFFFSLSLIFFSFPISISCSSLWFFFILSISFFFFSMFVVIKIVYIEKRIERKWHLIFFCVFGVDTLT